MKTRIILWRTISTTEQTSLSQACMQSPILVLSRSSQCSLRALHLMQAHPRCTSRSPSADILPQHLVDATTTYPLSSEERGQRTRSTRRSAKRAGAHPSPTQSQPSLSLICSRPPLHQAFHNPTSTSTSHCILQFHWALTFG